MRPSPGNLVAALVSLAAASIPMPAVAAPEATRRLEARLDADPAQPFAVENLMGRMRVTASAVDRVMAVATVHAESDELASTIRIEQVSDAAGRPALRVRYPFDRSLSYRLPMADWAGSRGDGGSRIEYDGRRDVRVGARDGLLVWVDVEVRVPPREVEGVFRNRVGPIEASGLKGRVRLDTGSGDIVARDLDGDVVADTGSGNVTAEAVSGRFTCDTGSGDCDVSGFRGESLRCDTGSGDVLVRDAHARRVVLDTGSGRVKVLGGEVEEVSADTGSGDVEVDAAGLTRLKADTGSGDVRLRLGADASFEARVDMGGGALVSRYRDAAPIVRGREVVGYRRGDARTRISIDTGGGDVILEPGER